MFRRELCLALVFAGVAVGGCDATFDQLQGMRKSGSAWMSRRNQKWLLESFDALGGKKPKAKWVAQAVWRVEAIRTMSVLDRKFTHAAAEPELHSALVETLKKEYRSPQTKSPADEAHRLRAWCVYCLGQVGDAGLIDFFVDVLDENPLAKDADYRICLAALNSLHPNVETLLAARPLRRRMLYKLASMSADVRGGRLSTASTCGGAG